MTQTAPESGSILFLPHMLGALYELAAAHQAQHAGRNGAMDHLLAAIHSQHAPLCAQDGKELFSLYFCHSFTIEEGWQTTPTAYHTVKAGNGEQFARARALLLSRGYSKGVATVPFGLHTTTSFLFFILPTGRPGEAGGAQAQSRWRRQARSCTLGRPCRFAVARHSSVVDEQGFMHDRRVCTRGLQPLKKVAVR